ncbi:N-acetylmuramic acid 6-phosphate etherase [Phycisphaerales bacterium AB-hyl4]|uniref:N-acetylmuramic acid 6-phosphate etherase n=1 Tax=Natronomicrosphaera hydrolytica TaxID=3242702 RepID=A0ABV4TZS6_9BACT
MTVHDTTNSKSEIPNSKFPDRGHLLTEQRNTSTAAIDALSVEQALRAINTQDMNVPRIVRDAIPAITKLVETVVERMRRGGRLVYIGAGTSGRLGVLDASECPPTFHTDPDQVVGLIAGGDNALRQSSEGKEDEHDGAHAELRRIRLNENDTLVGIAAGGTTPYVWGALAYAREQGSATALMTCVLAKTLMTRERAPVVKANQPIAPPAPPRLPVAIDHIIELPVGPEAITGSTRMKAGTATKLALNMISTATMIQLGKTWGNLMVDLRATNAKLRDRALRILMHQANLAHSQAEDLLDTAQGSVKLALVMARLDLSAHDAQRRLDESNGQLRPLIGPPR